ncbi:GNAT family N-acetyltransferase [Vibrio campbellii]
MKEARVAGNALMEASSENYTQWILSLSVETEHRGKGVAR